jgi:hypothetical protein
MRYFFSDTRHNACNDRFGYGILYFSHGTWRSLHRLQRVEGGKIMRIEHLPSNELAIFAAHITELLAGGELSAIDPAVRAALIAAIGTKPATLSVRTARAEALDGEKKAAFSARDETHADIVEWSRQVRDLLKAVGAPKHQFDLCGFDYPAARSNTYHAQEPTNVAAVGYSNGVNTIRFKGNNRHGLVTYEIWRREGATSSWQPYALTRKQSFDDMNVTPGQYYEYRVRAVAAKTTSGFSNATIVYGVL